MKGRKHYILFFVIASILILTGMLGDARAAEKTPIKVGIVFDFTGPFAGEGKLQLPAAQMLFEEKGMEVAGRKIELIIEDAATSPTVTLSKVKKLVEMDNVHLLLIGQNTAAGYAVRDYIDANKIPTLALALGAAHTRKGYSRYFFRVNASIAQSAYPGGKWWYNYGFKKIIWIGLDFAAGHELYEAFKKGLEEAGGQMVQDVWVPMGVSDFGPYLPKLMIGKADAILAILWGSPSIRFIKQWNEYGLKKTIPVIGFGSVFDEGLTLPVMGLDAEGVYQTNFGCVTTDTAQNKKFIEEYRKRTGVLPYGFAYSAYIASEIGYQAMSKIGGEVEDKEKLVDVLEKTALTTPMGGQAYFDKRHGLVWDVVFMQVRRTNGEVHLFEIGRIKDVKDPVEVFP